MTRLDDLTAARSLSDVAFLLGFKRAALSFILYKQGDANKYKSFLLAKRSGGTRQINAPTSQLKLVQKRLSSLLQDCMQSINESHGYNDRISHGFKRTRSILTNAKCHRRRRYVLNVDIKDFFGSINFGRVRGFFLKDRNFSLDEKVATVLAQIACFNNALPQGSPCSPVISNLIGHILDIHLVRLASAEGCTYTRYADDLTFSTNKRDFPVGIATPMPGNPHVWTPGVSLVERLTASGFELNPLKTRMQYRDSRQEVTGLVVNRKVNVRKEYRYLVRAMVYKLLKTGSFEISRLSVDANGASVVIKEPGSLKQLHGMLGFVDALDLYNRQLERRALKAASQADGLKRSVPNITKKEETYRRFLIYKELYVPPAPVIIGEGRSDNVYLVHAIRGLAQSFPALATINPDKTITLRVRLFKCYNTSTGRILRLRGGTGDLKEFITTYKNELKHLKAPGQKHPVLMIIDNDGGATAVFSAISEITKVKPTGNEPYIHVIGNLYVVPTPKNPEGGQSKVEDFFDASVTSTLLNGKTFAAENDFDSENHYGKMAFAKNVVRPNADTINFDGFKNLLTNVTAAISTHAQALSDQSKK
jgi:RNA-directed DNA polymerase